MTKTTSKIVSVIFGLFAIYIAVNLISDKTKKKFTALDKHYSFTKSIRISEKFETDFTSVYSIIFSFEKSNETLVPIKKKLEVYSNGKPIELYGNKNNYFETKAGAEYELNLELENTKDNFSLNTFNLSIIEDGLPGPIYQLYFEREYKWVSWFFEGFIILIAVIFGFFGFRKKRQ